MIILSAAETYKLCSDEGKPVNTSVKETRSEKQFSSPSVRILENSCYFLSSGWIHTENRKLSSAVELLLFYTVLLPLSMFLTDTDCRIY